MLQCPCCGLIWKNKAKEKYNKHVAICHPDRSVLRSYGGKFNQ